MNQETVRQLLGQRLAVGFEGLEIPEDFRALVKEYRVGNVILFRRNVHDYAQLRKLNTELTGLILEETGIPPFIMMDEECGSVSRLSHITTATPGAMAIGATGDTQNAYAIGRMIGRELRSAGINFNLAPVLDVMSNPLNRVIGTRSFGFDPQTVSDMACAYLEGVQSTGVYACGKHFPGHGDTSVDSHIGLPVIEKPREEIERVELLPFRAAIRDGIKAIMSAHCIFPAFEPERVPATVSRKVMTGLLRESLGFGGIILSDGMEMKAVMDLYGVEEGVLRALKAGIDIALVCHSPKQASDTLELCMKALNDGELSPEELQARYGHILLMKKDLPSGPAGDESDFCGEEQRQMVSRVMQEAVRILYAPDGKPLPAVDASAWFFGSKSRKASLANDDDTLNAPRLLAEACGGHYAPDDSPEGILTAAAQCGRTMVSVLNANDPDLPERIRLTDALCRSSAPVIAVAMSAPFPLEQLHGPCWKICTYQYDRLALNALTDRLVRRP